MKIRMELQVTVWKEIELDITEQEFQNGDITNWNDQIQKLTPSFDDWDDYRIDQEEYQKV